MFTNKSWDVQALFKPCGRPPPSLPLPFRPLIRPSVDGLPWRPRMNTHLSLVTFFPAVFNIITMFVFLRSHVLTTPCSCVRLPYCSWTRPQHETCFCSAALIYDNVWTRHSLNLFFPLPAYLLLASLFYILTVIVFLLPVLQIDRVSTCN